MDRRAFLGMTAAAAALAAGPAGAAPAVSLDGLVLEPHERLRALAVEASACARAGDECLRHCLEQTAAGHGADFARCLAAVVAMQEICRTTSRLAAQRSALLKSQLVTCIAACEACRVECEAHAPHFAHGMHLECQACMERCASCRDLCREVQGLL